MRINRFFVRFKAQIGKNPFKSSGIHQIYLPHLQKGCKGAVFLPVQIDLLGLVIVQVRMLLKQAYIGAVEGNLTEDALPYIYRGADFFQHQGIDTPNFA